MRYRWNVIFAVIISLNPTNWVHSEETVPRQWVPEGTLLTIRVANPESIATELAELGPEGSGLNLTQFVAGFLGIPFLDGVAENRAWFAFLGEGKPGERGPWILLPLSDESAFHSSIAELPPTLEIHSDEAYALVGQRPLPKLGGRFLSETFAGNIELQADLERIFHVYQTEIEQYWAKGELLTDWAAEAGLPPQSALNTWQSPFSLENVIKGLQPQLSAVSEIVAQCELLTAQVDSAGGKLKWSVKLDFGAQTSLGRLVESQQPRAVDGLEHLDPDSPTVYWLNLQLSRHAESLFDLIRPFLASATEENEESFRKLVFLDSVTAWAIEPRQEGVDIETVVSAPDMNMEEYRSLILQVGLEDDAGDMENTFEEEVTKIGSVAVDRFVQKRKVESDEETIPPTETFYGWGKDKAFIVSSIPAGEDSGLNRLEKMISRPEKSFPEDVREALTQLPQKLVFLTWTHPSKIVERIQTSTPTGALHDMSGLPAIIGYATAQGHQLELGSLQDLGRLTDRLRSISETWARARSFNETANNYYYGLNVEQDYAKAFEWYEKAAQLGYDEAQINLGHLYEEGKGVTKDVSKAIEHYRLAADQGSERAQAILGDKYQQGLGVPRDYDEARRWFEKALEQGYPQAYSNIGFMYEMGQGVERDRNEAIKNYEKAAELGDVWAQGRLGDIYQDGDGVPVDYAKALEWFQKAAEQGDEDSRTSLAYMYAYGQGVQQDYIKAQKLYRTAADHGNARAQSELGDMYQDGRGVEQDFDEAMKWFLKSAEQNYSRAHANIGYMYEMGQGRPRDYDKAFQYYQKAVEDGYSWAENRLGRMYFLGRGVTKDYARAIEWYRKAAEKGFAVAQNNLGYCYEAGRGVARDYDKARALYLESAQKNNSLGQYRLGLLYLRGNGVEQDDVEANRWFSKAAEKGHVDAQNSLGWAYEKGLGVEQDYGRAREWYLKSAEKNNAWAQNQLGTFYTWGDGVEKDYEEAIKWYRKAAENGYAEAQRELARFYIQGWGVPRDFETAVSWIRRAADQGDAEAQSMLAFAYEVGHGVEQNFEESHSWYLKSAEQGFASAQANLGIIYLEGKGVSQNSEKALYWTRKAADQSSPQGLMLLGGLYYKGQGVPQDYIRAYVYFSKATSVAPEPIRESAEMLLTETARKMTAEQLDEAKKLIEAGHSQKEEENN